jgi:ABC-type branched-subunit amino acid transport system ATPase component/ABC-type branched-subunit amino acid transport system permease subunit
VPHIELTGGLLALGAIEGVTFGVLAVALVLVYRTSSVINFAQGEMGAVGAALCGVAVVNWGLPYWVAFAAALIVSGSIGGVTEIIVIRRLRSAPRVMSLVATLGVASFLLSITAMISQSVPGSAFPQPANLPHFVIGNFLVTPAHSAMLFVTPVVVAALALFLRFSRFGMALRAASANPERARLAGVSAARMSTLAWVIAGALSGYAVVLILPTQGFITASVFGPGLLLRGLVPAVIARMRSIPIALIAGIGIGIVDQVLIFNNTTGGVSEAFLLGIILVVLLLQSPRGTRLELRENWSQLVPWRPAPANLSKVWVVQNLARCLAALGLVGAVLLGLGASNTTAVSLSTIVAFSLIGLSIGVLTGLAGQVSLGQFAVAAIGGVISYQVSSHTGNYLLALGLAVVGAGVLSMLLGLPALRIRGLLLAVITLGFAIAAERYFLSQSWAFGEGVDPGRPTIFGISLEMTRSYYLYSLVVLVLAMIVVRNVWTGGIGLKLRAQRDNDDAARAFALRTTLIREQGFLIAGTLAGAGGALYTHLLSYVSASSFDVNTSINIVALAVLGGVGIMSGPILGALYIIGLPLLVPLNSAGLAATSLGWLLLILYFPGGIAQVLAAPRQRLLEAAGKRAAAKGAASDEEAADEASDASAGFAALSATLAEGQHADELGDHDSQPILTVDGISRRYGGVVAVDNASLVLNRGEILGIIGPNGAGKTTLFEIISGFTKSLSGTVVFDGHNITSASPQRRAGLGLIRSFQDCALFPTLTVEETIALACERTNATHLVPSALGLHRRERTNKEIADRLIAGMGLDPFRGRQISELSTGTRRIVDLACVVALKPRVVLFDEPSSGIAQRESEALGDVILALREFLDASFIVIEHDIPLLMRVSDRVIAMDSGRVIAEGDPHEVQKDPKVMTSYLGGDVLAVERSGHLSDNTARADSFALPMGREQ